MRGIAVIIILALTASSFVNYVLRTWGSNALLWLAIPSVLSVWVISLIHENIVMGRYGGRPVAFYGVLFIGYALCVVVLAALALPSRRLHISMRILICTILGSLVGISGWQFT